MIKPLKSRFRTATRRGPQASKYVTGSLVSGINTSGRVPRDSDLSKQLSSGSSS